MEKEQLSDIENVTPTTKSSWVNNKLFYLFNNNFFNNINIFRFYIYYIKSTI